MPSWNEGEETSSEEHLTDYSSEIPLNVPEKLYDRDFCGIEEDCQQTCDHGEKFARHVAFEGADTGRRFLGCARSSGYCGAVYWLDLEWSSPSLKNSLVRLWELYDSESSMRIKEGCDQAQARYKLKMEKKQLEEKNMELRIELGKALSASQGSSSSSPDNNNHVANMLVLHKVAREKAEKKRDEMIEENKRLTVMKDLAEAQRDAFSEEKKSVDRAFGSLFNAGENNKQKLKKIEEILDA